MRASRNVVSHLGKASFIGRSKNLIVQLVLCSNHEVVLLDTLFVFLPDVADGMGSGTIRDGGMTSWADRTDPSFAGCPNVVGRACNKSQKTKTFCPKGVCSKGGGIFL